MKASIQKYTPPLDNKKQPTGETKYTLRMSFGFDPTGMVGLYRDTLKNWDERIIHMAQDNCVEWFKKKEGSLSEEAAKDMYCPMLSVSIDPKTLEEDGKYPDATRFRLQVKEDGSFDGSQLSIYDEEQNTITNVNDIPSGSHVIAIVKCTGIWFAAGQYGVGWRVVQMQVFKPQRITGFSFLPDLEPEDDNMMSGNGGAEAENDETETTNKGTKRLIQDDDEEDENNGANDDDENNNDDEEEEQPPVEPEPVKKKQATGKRGQASKKKVTEDF